jgi:Mrp family chromosome partitioning ATPase
MSRIRRIGALRVLRRERNVRRLGESPAVVGDSLQTRADAFAARIEALAAALRASGVPGETAERLISQASAAALQALTLELLLEDADRRQTSVLAPLLETREPPGRRFPVAA